MNTYRGCTYIFIILILICGSVPTFSAVIEVPKDQPTIQSGIDGAKDGDTVLVVDGIYRGEGNVNLDFRGKRITLKSQNGAKTTIIDCESNPDTRGFRFQNKETYDSVLDGFTIKNGRHNIGGGIYCNDASPTITNCVIAWNRAVDNNRRTGGGGGGIYCFNSDTKIIDSTISNNRAESVYGGGVYFNGDAIIDGVFVRETPSQPSLLNCTISDNTGSGVHIQHFVKPSIKYSKILHNSWRGIACNLYHTNGTFITHCEIAQNTGGGVAAFEYSTLEITHSIIKQNTDREGGGIFCGTTANVYVSYCIIAENVATESGGGIHVSSKGETTIEFCTITQNRAHEKGGGIYVFTDGHFLLSNSILWGNEADISHSEAFISQYLFGRFTITANDINGKIEDIVRIFVWDRTLIEGNIHEDPLFIDAAGGNYRVKPNSPAYEIGAHSILNGLVSVTSTGNKVVMWADLKRKR